MNCPRACLNPASKAADSPKQPLNRKTRTRSSCKLTQIFQSLGLRTVQDEDELKALGDFGNFLREILVEPSEIVEALDNWNHYRDVDLLIALYDSRRPLNTRHCFVLHD